MSETDLLTKRQIAAEFSDGDKEMSVRNVERMLSEANIKPAVAATGRGHESKYRREDVERMRAARAVAAEKRAEGTQALQTTTKPAVALVELLEGQRASFSELAATLDPWPVWMTTKQALELSGLAPSWLYAGLRKGELAVVGTRRTRRIHRDDLRRFAERVREADYLKTLLERPTKGG